MKRVFIVLMLTLSLPLKGQSDYTYIDHRGHNLDSLEHVASAWTKDIIDNASDEEAAKMVSCWGELMNGYLQINGVRSKWYAGRILDVASARKWDRSIYDASKILGQHMWAQEKFDSAAFWYNNALEAAQRMAGGSTSFMNPEGYKEGDIDDAFSTLYGTLGNLYSSQGQVDEAMEHYRKAGEIFKKHGWLESLAVLHYNMGETLGAVDRLDEAWECYGKCLDYAVQANDSLWIATAYKGMGATCLTRGQASKALKYLDKANSYYALHNDQEYMSQIETLDYTGQMLRMQKRNMAWIIAALSMVLILFAAVMAVAWKLRRTAKEKKEAETVLEETIEELRPAEATVEVPADVTAEAPAEKKKKEEIKLTERERQILSLIASGKTNPQIAEQVFLSPETIKWYRRKLLVKFDAANSAELVKKAQAYIS